MTAIDTIKEVVQANSNSQIAIYAGASVGGLILLLGIAIYLVFRRRRARQGQYKMQNIPGPIPAETYLTGLTKILGQSNYTHYEMMSTMTSHASLSNIEFVNPTFMTANSNPKSSLT